MSKAARIPKNVREEKLRLCPSCAVCHSTVDLELNHIDPDKPSTIDNLIVLCSYHHGLWHEMSSRNRHADQVRKAIADAKKRGVHFGKPCADYEKVMRLIAENSTQFNDPYNIDYEPLTEHEIMDMAGVREGCYAKCKRMLLDALGTREWPYSWRKPKRLRNRPMYDWEIRRLRGELIDH